MINFSIYKNVPSIPISNLSKYHLSDNFPTYNIRLEPEKKVEQEIEETPKRFTKTDKLVISKPNKINTNKISTSKTKINNNSSFMKVLDKMAASDPAIAKNKDILSKLAMAESSQRWNARNGRAYGAFQLMDFNIKGDVNDFLNNPEEQIRQANRLLESNKRQITDNDLKLAKEQGYTYNSLLGGSWLGGIGGMRKVLTNTGNPSDKDGADVKSRMQKFRFDTGGEIPNPAYPRFQINNWLDNWNKARLDTGNFDDQLGNGLLEQQKQNRDNTPIFYDSQTRDEELGITNPMMSRSFNSNIGLSSDGTNISVTPGFYYQGNQSLNPFIQILTPEARDALNQNYNNKLTTLQNRFNREDIEWQKLQANKTLVDNAFNSLSDFDSTLLHEQSHASIATPQENRIDQIITNKLDNYLDSPTEIYSRLNQLRKYYNFDPNKLWDKKDIRELKRKNGPTFDILDRYSDEELIRLFNEVADNSSIPSDQYTIYARNGVKLTKEQQEYINRLQKNQPQLKADNRTKELKEALNRDSKNKRIGNTIKEAALNTAEGITSAAYPVVGTGLAIKNAFTNPTGAYIDVASMVIPQLKGIKSTNRLKVNPITDTKNNVYFANKVNYPPQQDVDDFYKLITDKDVRAKMKASDQQFGTKYEEAADILQKQYEETGELFDNKYMKVGDLHPESDGASTVIEKTFKEDPTNPRGYTYVVRSSRELETTGHELRHLFEKFENGVRAKANNKTEELVDGPGKLNDRLTYPRIDNILENNTVDLETFKNKVKEINKTIEDNVIEKFYNYYSDNDEFNSFIQNLVSYRQNKGLSPVLKYDTVEDFITDVKNAAKETNGSKLSEYIMFMIKDPRLLLDKLNKYGWSVILPIYLKSLNQYDNEVQN